MLSGSVHHITFMVSVPKQRKLEFDLNIQGRRFLGIKLYKIQDKKKIPKGNFKVSNKKDFMLLKIKNI